MANFTFDQIANYLTDGYAAANNETPSMFDLSVDRVLSYDISRLSAQAQLIAVQAFDVWSAVTGITFVSEGVTGVALTETTDAGLLSATTYTIGTNTEISGTIANGADEDHYRVTLTAGETYLVGLSNYPGGTLGDAVLELLDSAGNVLASSDSPDIDAGEYVTFTAATTGTYYLAASGFEETSGTYGMSIQSAVDITFGDMDQTGAYAFSESTNNLVDHSYINIADNWDTLNLNGYMLQTYIHEIGHSLGLGHAGNYNGSATWGVSNHYDNDSWSATIMSYFDQQQNTNDPGSFAYLLTYMPADVIAIQNIYGAGPTGFATGDTTWGEGGNVVMGSFQDILDRAIANDQSDPFLYNGQPIAFTIYDTGGTDTINSSSSTVSQTINLNELTYSSLFGETGNVAIARGTVIENAVGGSGADTMTGNAVGNNLTGGGGVDVIHGGLGNDVITDNGNNTVRGEGGNDTIVNTAVNGGIWEGGLNVDTLDTSANSTSSWTYNLSVANFVILGATFSGFENVTDGSGSNTLIGSLAVNVLIGNGGNDTINGGAGGDILDGGAGTGDTVSYAGSGSVTVNLLAGTATGGHATGDTISGFENVTGSGQSDVIAGDANANVLKGELGTGDLITYAASNALVNVNLTTNVVSGGHAEGDTISGFERVIGSGFDDVLAGTVFANQIAGGGGNDTVFGDAGADSLTGGNGFDTLDHSLSAGGVTINLALNTSSGGNAAGDIIGTFERVNGSNGGVDVLTGTAGVNILRGNGGNDFIEGGAGADILEGGLGSADTVLYTSSNAAVTVNLLANTASGGHATGDTISGFENATGSAHVDTLIGSNIANKLNGGLGNDTLTGGGSSDSFVFDSVLGATNIDTITDYSVVSDTIHLDDAIFSALGAVGALAPALFGFAATADASDRIIYDQATGALFYDTNGNVAGERTQFATLTTGLAMTAADFLVV